MGSFEMGSFEIKKNIEEDGDDGMKKKMKKKIMMKKKNTNFQKGHKTFRDFQIGHKLLRGKIVHLVKVKGCLTLTNRNLTIVSNLQKNSKLHRGYLEFQKL